MKSKKRPSKQQSMLRIRITRTYEETFIMTVDGLTDAAEFVADPSNGLVDGSGEVCTFEVIHA